jgi:hypothetical protein
LEQTTSKPFVEWGEGIMGEGLGEEIDQLLSRTSLKMIKGSEWL